MRDIEKIEERIARFDARLLAELESERNALALLQTIPGVDLIGAAMLLVEISADMDAFGSSDRLASWVGICLGNNESAGKRKPSRIRKGNLYVRRLLCEFAHAAGRTTSVFKLKFRSLVAAASAPSSLSVTRFCAPSSSCSSCANITGIPPLTMKRCPFNVMPLAGSKP